MDGWLIALVSAGVIVVVVLFLLSLTSVIVAPGTIALLLKRGKATRRALEPGRHFLLPWQKRTMQVYPSRELTLVAGGRSVGDARVEFVDDPLRVHLADRTLASISYTVRCRLETDKVRDVHNRFGPEGIWAALRDAVRSAILAEVTRKPVTIEGVFGSGFEQLEKRCTKAVGASLDSAGFDLRLFTLREVDLGETGEVVQSTARADAELERERAFAEVRRARLEHDAEMGEVLSRIDGDLMLRYRQLDAWRDILARWSGGPAIPPALTTPLMATMTQAYQDEPAPVDEPNADDAVASDAEP